MKRLPHTGVSYYRKRRLPGRQLEKGILMTGKASILLALLLVLSGCSSRKAAPYEGKSVAQLERMLHDPSTDVQIQGAVGLSLHGAEAKPAVPSLIPLLHSEQALVRQNAAAALTSIGPDADEAVPALTEALADPEWSVRRQAAMALGEIGAPARSAAPALKRLQSDPNTLVRKAAAAALMRVR
jgi:HEAT repeat protein